MGEYLHKAHLQSLLKKVRTRAKFQYLSFLTIITFTVHVLVIFSYIRERNPLSSKKITMAFNVFKLLLEFFKKKKTLSEKFNGRIRAK